MCDEVWWIRRNRWLYERYETRAAAEKWLQPLSTIQPTLWDEFKGPRLAHGEIIAIRPLWIKQVIKE